VRAELTHAAAQRFVANGRRDVRAGRPAELDRCGADSAGRAVDEQALAGAQSRLGEGREPTVADV